MCGRFTLRNTKKIKTELGIDIVESYNITPSSNVVSISDKAQIMTWGFNPSWSAKPMNMINARSETMKEKKSFKWAKRCLIVADGWYEWVRKENGKQPYFFKMFDDKHFYFAGINNLYLGVRGCAIVTRDASDRFAPIHKRMPVLLRENEAEKWLKGHEIFDSTLHEEIQFHPVSKLVNSPKNNTEECVTPIN